MDQRHGSGGPETASKGSPQGTQLRLRQVPDQTEICGTQTCLNFPLILSKSS